MDKEVIHQGWLELSTDTSLSKSWMKLPIKKSWKRKYFVLYHLVEDIDKIYLDCYEKEENWPRENPKKTLNMYPRYKIAKLASFKGKENVLEVDNEVEQWHLVTDKVKIMDLWAVQIQMQTKLSRVISGRIFCVSGAVNKQMQKIGAAQQRCLLHFTKWGITLALQDSRAILAMWPLKTIRNYENFGNSQFSIEAGRRAPMGDGKYVFNTNIGQDEEMFNVLDLFIAAVLNEKAELNPNKKNQPVTDEEILKSYDQLHRSVTATKIEPRGKRNDIDTVGYAHIGNASGGNSLLHDPISMYKPPDYNHLYGEKDFNQVDIERKISSCGSSKSDDTSRCYSFNTNDSNYDKLDRSESWGEQTGYDHIHKKVDTRARGQNSYHRLDRHDETQSLPKQNAGFVGYPLRDEPSVPFLDDNVVPFRGRSNFSSLSKTPDDEKYEFRNSIYTPAVNVQPTSAAKTEDTAVSYEPMTSSRHESTSNDYDRLGCDNTKTEETAVSYEPMTSSRLGSTSSEYDKLGFNTTNTEDTAVSEPMTSSRLGSTSKDYDRLDCNNTNTEDKAISYEPMTSSPVGLTPSEYDKLGFNLSNTEVAPVFGEPATNSRHGSTSSENDRPGINRTKQRASSSFKDRPMKDIADHFLYQMPSSFSAENGFNKSITENVSLETSTSEVDDMYQNAESVSKTVENDTVTNKIIVDGTGTSDA